MAFFELPYSTFKLTNCCALSNDLEEQLRRPTSRLAVRWSGSMARQVCWLQALRPPHRCVNNQYLQADS